MISKSKIGKIGDRIKRGEFLTKAENTNLQDWRKSFVPILDYYPKKATQKIDEESIVALGKRLKRIPSIHSKLKRSKTLRLSSMQDIAGLRIGLKNQSAMLAAANTMRSSQSKNKFKRMYDYHSQPKEDGDRSIHLVYQSVK
tara:strand:- start:6971 stop:7396 length:426 start_codon:yes stop_codon:yes gene_type:complete